VPVFLFLAAMAGGALNAVAGGGSFIALPALIAAGVPAVSANATTTFALWPGSMSSAVAYRRDVGRTGAGASVVMLGVTSLIGGLAGAWLLLETSDAKFLRVLPWLMLAAALTFTFGGALTKRLRRAGASSARPGLPIWLFLVQLTIATYGGYFGGGMGIMMLAALAISGLTDMHAMNGIKSLLAVAINGIAMIAFVAMGAIAWVPGLTLAGGGIVGGNGGASLARRVDPARIRVLAIAVAWLMTAYFFIR
jgi:uncharacterized membrane protein YfcA